MTAYIAITDAETDPEAPLTSELAKKWRDNPLAIAEGDTSVPSSLLSSAVLLGTLTTTSGTSQSLTGLNLNPYSLVYFEFLTVSVSGANPILLGGVAVTPSVGGGGANSIDGIILLNLTSGRATGITSQVGSASVVSGATGYSKTTTTLTFTAPPAAFDLGSIRVYGIK